jgi:plastocyanin
VRRFSSIVVAILLLMGLCTPSALMAQDPATPVEEPQSPSDPAAGDPQPDPTAPPADPGQEPSSDPTVPGEPQPAPGTEPAPANVATLAVASGAGTVAVADFSFTPASITVDVGDTVTWTNSGPDEPHTATANDGSFDTGEIAVGASASHTFDQAGTFAYVCSIHPDQMSGTVTVASTGAGGGSGPDETSGTSAPSGSEAAAVAAPDAAGTASSLPSTGLVALPLALIGLGLVALGVRVRRGATGPRG